MKILVRLPNWLGDMVMSTAFLSALTKTYPNAVIHVIVKKELKELAAFIPDITAIHTFSKEEFKGLREVYRFGKGLKHEQFDLFFCLPDSFSSALAGFASGAKKRVGFGKEGRFFLLTSRYKKPPFLHRVNQYLSLLEQFTGKTISDPQVKLNPSHAISPMADVLINFNSEAQSRRMPVEKAKELLCLLTSAFPKISFRMMGSAKDKPYIQQILAGLPQFPLLTDISGQTALGELTNLISSSKLLLTTDSGPAHLANSLGIPTVVLFGAGNEANTAPFNKKDLHVIRAGKLPCEPCVKNTCSLYAIPECMNLLGDRQIIETLHLYLPDA